MNRIYLDYASATPLLPGVRAAMEPWLAEAANPSSIHEAGRRAKAAVERARGQIAALIGAKPEEISFTSCGTEANNWALRGLVAANKRKRTSLDSGRSEELGPSLGTPPHGPVRGAPHLIVSGIEHPSVLLAAKRLAIEGAELTILPVDHDGLVSPAALKAALTPQTVLVSIMTANGEVGTIEPIQELTAIAHEQGALFHTDAVAAAGHIAVDVKTLGVDSLTLAANQFYGPQGAAALFVRDGVRILPLLEGGGQEHGGRSGTEPVAMIVGMGVAADLAREATGQLAPARVPRRPATSDRPSNSSLRSSDMTAESVLGRRAEPANRSRDSVASLAVLRDRLRDGLMARIESVRINGSQSSRLPHNLHLCIDGVSSESLVLGLDQAGIAAGLGSACNSKAMRPSHVLKAMGLTDAQAAGAVVFTVGISTTEAEIDRALEVIPTVVQRLRHVTALTARA